MKTDEKPRKREQKRTEGSRARSLFILIHRYVGLTIAVFLIVAGLTGSIIAFMHDLESWVSPELFVVHPAEGAEMLDPFELRDRVQAQMPGKALDGVSFETEAGHAVSFGVDGKDVFVDPYTAKILGDRVWGDITQGKKNLLPFIYKLHFTLALEDVGIWIFGIVALLWTLDCFVGAYLTFPLPLSANAGSKSRSWIRRWLPAWLIKTSKLYSLVFSWHRASGLWVWFFCLVFGWSAVALNLHDQVYRPVMGAFMDLPPSAWDKVPHLKEPKIKPALELRAAYQVAKRLMREEGAQRGFRVLTERWLSYDAERGVYSYWVESTLDVSRGLGETHVIFDGDTGASRGFSARAGLHAFDTFTTWIIALHFGSVRIGGLPYRIFVCLFGLLVVALSVTGVWIWWRKAELRRKKGVRNATREETTNAVEA
jgi:uncharacterized iron-regulated membrane protein